MMLPSGFLTKPIAHRAYHDKTEARPENSRAAIRAAIEAGYAIEIDLQLSRDGVAMVFHDDNLDRLTAAKGPVVAQDAASLQQIILHHADEGIPTFRQVLDIVAGQVPLLVEIKNQAIPGGAGIGPLERATAEALLDYAGPVAVMSFNPESVAEMARLAPDVPRGLTTASYEGAGWGNLPDDLRSRLRDIAHYDATGACFISHEASDLARPRVLQLKAQGAGILCWTIRSAADEASAREIADNVTFEGYAA